MENLCCFSTVALNETYMKVTICSITRDMFERRVLIVFVSQIHSVYQPSEFGTLISEQLHNIIPTVYYLEKPRHS